MENNFSSVAAAQILIREGEEIFREFLVGACSEKIFHALEIRRGQNQWQVEFVGQGIGGTVNQLYDLYGVGNF